MQDAQQDYNERAKDASSTKKGRGRLTGRRRTGSTARSNAQLIYQEQSIRDLMSSERDCIRRCTTHAPCIAVELDIRPDYCRV